MPKKCSSCAFFPPTYLLAFSCFSSIFFSSTCCRYDMDLNENDDSYLHGLMTTVLNLCHASPLWKFCKTASLWLIDLHCASRKQNAPYDNSADEGGLLTHSTKSNMHLRVAVSFQIYGGSPHLLLFMRDLPLACNLYFFTVLSNISFSLSLLKETLKD